MKKSFMTRVLAVSLSAAMAFSMSSASNLMTASAASTVALKTTFKTLKVNQKYKLTLKNNTLNWKITKVTTSNKKICTVYGKTASSVMLKGKGVGRAKISVKVKTTKRKYPKNIKIMKCTANVKAATDQGQTTAFSATGAVANSNTEVRVSFNQEIDAPEASNFAVSDGVTVSKAELSADKKSVLLTIAGAEYGKSYDLTVTGIKVAGKEQAEQKLTFVTPAATEKYPMTLEAKDKILKSDGQSQTLVTFTIKDENGNLITDKGVEVAFATSLGKFAEQRVSIQNGVATVMYTSEALMETQTAAITATVVESTDNQELMGLSTTSSITLTPNPDALNNTAIGAVITSVTAPTADRVIAYFNQKVEAKDFLTTSGNVDHTKFDCKVKSGLDNSFEEPIYGVTPHNVVGILDVPGDENALQLLVDGPMTDNTNIEVEFENKITTNALISPKNKVYCKLADAHQPSVLDVSSEGLRTITVTFSEAVLPHTMAGGIGAGTAEQFSADWLANYAIDGIPLNNSQWNMEINDPDLEGNNDSTDINIKKISSKEDSTDTSNDKKGTIKVGSYQKGTDNRHVVTIKLGGDSYLTTGTHSLSISNVGDWAAKTDRERNIVNTQAFDFTVADNDVIPTFEVEEQSPEQYLLKFNSDVVAVDQTFRTPNSAEDASSLQLQELVGSTWVTISDNATASGKNPIRVSQVRDEKGDLTNNYIVEVKRDWTEVYNTSGTRQNYFNKTLRLHVDANKLRNTANNKLNADISIPLNGSIMTNPDLTSPVIGDVVQAEDTSGNPLESYNVTLSEPVKLSDKANEEGLTPNQTQAATASAKDPLGVPMPSAQFIRVDNGQTVEGIITDDVFIDAEDTTINIAPESTLGAGKWRLAISSISDDWGNTASTVVHEIDVTREVTTTNFRIVWAAVSAERSYTEFVKKTHNSPHNDKGRYIFVKFNKPVMMSGNSVNAGVTANYTINGATLPTGTQILANIRDYDDHDGVTDSITIILPESNFTTAGQFYNVDAKNAMLNVSNAITSTSGETLTNGGMKRLPFQYGSATNTYGNANAVEVEDDCYNLDGNNVLGYKSDAVWGNDASERWSGSGDANFKDLKAYYQALKNALADEKYRRVILTADIDLSNLKPDESTGTGKDQAAAISVFGRSRTLTINRAVDFDLGGKTINANVVVSTTDAVDQIAIYSIGSQAVITGAIDKAGTAALTVNAGSAKHFVLNNVTVNPAANANAVNINDTFKESFLNKGTINGDIAITDANGAGFDNQGTLNHCTLKIDSNGEVNLKGDLKQLAELVVSQAVSKLSFGTDNATCDIKGLKIRVTATGARVVFTANVDANSRTTFISAAPKVRVEVVNSSTQNDITWQKDKGGEIITVDKDNKEVSTGKIDDIQTTGIQAALDKLSVLDGSIKGTTVDDTQSVTSSAITGSGLNLADISDNIKTSVETELGDDFNRNAAFTVSYKLMTNNILEMNGSVVKLKANATSTSSDIIRFTISYDGYTRTKNLEVKLQ